MKRRLGVVLAGGMSRRFGSDKALAVLGGRPLIEHALATLAPQVADVAVVGRSWNGLPWIADRPEAGLGPLGGLCGALHHATAGGYSEVVSVACDMPDLPEDLVTRLARAGSPAFVPEFPVLGLWPAGLAERLESWLISGGDRSVRGWAAATGAAAAVAMPPLHNLNTEQDFRRLQQKLDRS